MPLAACRLVCLHRIGFFCSFSSRFLVSFLEFHFVFYSLLLQNLSLVDIWLYTFLMRFMEGDENVKTDGPGPVMSSGILAPLYTFDDSMLRAPPSHSKALMRPSEALQSPSTLLNCKTFTSGLKFASWLYVGIPCCPEEDFSEKIRICSRGVSSQFSLLPAGCEGWTDGYMDGNHTLQLRQDIPFGTSA